MGEVKRRGGVKSGRGTGTMSVDLDGDDYMIIQCQCGCDPMDIARALPAKGIWPYDPHVVEWKGAPALRTRAWIDGYDTPGVNKRRARR